MERFEPEISFDLPSHLNFDTFSTFPLTGSNNRSVPAEAAVTENFLRQLSEKIGRGISGSQLGLIRNQVILNGSVDPSEDWIRQAEYDKFMNEIWIGIVLTLIVISMVFCICSCFLYHQFRQWKNNYHRNLQQSNDIESVKLSIEDDDLPNYTLVSGLPSYDAALEQLQKSSTSNTCLLMYPSVFKIFTTNEKQDVLESLNNDEQSTEEHQQQRIVLNIAPSYQEAMGIATDAGETKTEEAPSYQEALLAINHS